jgi:hypothetical protein
VARGLNDRRIGRTVSDLPRQGSTFCDSAGTDTIGKLKP